MMLYRASVRRVAALSRAPHTRQCTRCLTLSPSGLSEVRVRFAPSPTGYLHLGGLRTALYNFLFAKANNGKFILRIEDTDQSRLIPEASEKLEEMLSWAKIPPDESPQVGGPVGPYVQSERLHLYQEYVKRLLENGSAYKCYCSTRRLNWLRNDAIRRNEVPRYDNRCRQLSQKSIDELEGKGTESCIRFKLEAVKEPYDDLIFGSLSTGAAEQEGDPVIMKADGYPTYHFANVVDDHLMGITHVLRGVEWQISTPKHLQLYRAFGWLPPIMGHLPLILNKDGSKLSKRQGDVHIEHYRAQGYTAEPVLNFVTDIGGGFEGRDTRLLLTVEELIQKFDVSRITKNSCRLDMEKLYHYNQLSLHRCLEDPTELKVLLLQLQDLLRRTYGERLSRSAAQEKVLSPDYLTQVLVWSKERITCLQDLVHPDSSYVWVLPDHLPLTGLPSMACSPVEVLKRVEELILSNSDDFTKENIVQLVKRVGKEYKLKTPIMMKFIRMAVSGLTLWRHPEQRGLGHGEGVLGAVGLGVKCKQTNMSEEEGALPAKRPQFGTRFLSNKKNVFEHNAWDNVVWDETQEAQAKAKVQVNSEVLLTPEEIEKLEQEASGQWNSFYGIHQNRFFKDRNWLFTEFPELAPHLAHTFPQKQNPGDAASTPATQHHNTTQGEAADSEEHKDASESKEEETPPSPAQCRTSESTSSTDKTNLTSVPCETVTESPHSCNHETSPTSSYPGQDATFRILEVGCGVGNTVFPILKTNNKEDLFVYCCDFSSTAVDIVKESPDYDAKRCDAFVCDLSSEEWEAPFPKGSLDIIVCIFVLSAIHPDKYPGVISRMVEYLRPGGLILYRDYGRYDLAQLRFKKGRCLADNFYVRGDGTRCYFTTQDEVRELMTQAGLEEVQNLVDRRLQVNRGKQLTMYRVWVQAKYRKPGAAAAHT